MKMFRQTTARPTAGFTLIELLTVIAIVGILASAVLVAINPSARIQASYDAQQKSEIGQIANALEAYATAHSGQYPSTSDVKRCDNCGADDNPNTTYTATDWVPSLVDDKFIKQLPHSPFNGQNKYPSICPSGSSYGYVYVSNGTDYKLMAYCTVIGGLNDTETSSTYCSDASYDESHFTANPAGHTALKSMVDPRRPSYAYAIYSKGYTCR